MFDQAPAEYLPQLLNVSGATEPHAFWLAVCRLLARVAPYRLAAVWSNTASLLFERDQGGEIVDSPQSTDYAYELRVGSLYNQLGGEMTPHVRRLPASEFGQAEHSRHPCLRAYDCDEAVTLVFALGSWCCATIALYGAEAASAGTAHEAALEALYPILSQLVVRHQEQAQQATLNTGMSDFLRHLPVGLAFYSWQQNLLFANDEAYRQSYLWNTVPSQKLIKNRDLRAVFALAPEIMDAFGVLSESRNHSVAQFEPVETTSLTIAHPLDPQRKAVVSLTLNHDQPLQTPNFVVRFKGLNSPSADTVFEPSSSQLSTLSELTAAERAVAMLVMKGLDNQSIATKLNREVSTVKYHLTQIYLKLGIKSRAQLISLTRGDG